MGVWGGSTVTLRNRALRRLNGRVVVGPILAFFIYFGEKMKVSKDGF